jgi:hypothetical protein
MEALQRDGTQRQGDPAGRPESADEALPRRLHAITCAACGREITDESQRIAVEGAHQHRFMNPEGYVYDIACFGEAPGCAVRGIPTGEFTWFRGFAWSYAVCRGCSAHLGWHYAGGEGAGFFGLIENRLWQEPAGEDQA